MESKEFKNVFEKVAKANNFEKAFGGLRKVLNVLSFFVYKNQILAIITN